MRDGREVTEETRAKIAAGIKKNKEAGLRKPHQPMSEETKAKL